MNEVLLRPGRVEDVVDMQAVEVAAGERFREVGLASIADDPPPAAQELQAHVLDGTAWVRTVDGEVVGYAVCSVVDDEGHLDQVSVRPDHSGAGHGRALVEQVLRWAAHRGFDAVTLTTFLYVPWNGPLYAHLGFAVVDEDELPPQLAAIRARERADGLDVAPRAAMRRLLADP